MSLLNRRPLNQALFLTAVAAATVIAAAARVDAAAATGTGTVSGTARTQLAAVEVAGGLEVRSLPIPEPASGEVRIRVRATGVNPVDWKSAARRASGPAPAAGSPPVVPGRDIAGVIDALGADVTGWKRGDRVLVFTPGGGYAQYAVVPASIVAAAPRKFSFRESAGLPLVAETAWRSLFEAADLKSGQRALIHGGAGGVGSAAVQLAKARGAYVIATASPRNHDYLRSIGADEVIDYKTVRFEQVVKDVDIVLNTVDADTGMRSIGVLRKGGTLVSVVGPPPADLVAAAGVRATAPVRDGKGLPVAQLLAEVVALADAGKYRVNVDQAFPLAEAARAWDAGRTNRTRGKLVIDLPE